MFAYIIKFKNTRSRRVSTFCQSHRYTGAYYFDYDTKFAALYKKSADALKVLSKIADSPSKNGTFILRRIKVTPKYYWQF